MAKVPFNSLISAEKFINLCLMKKLRDIAFFIILLSTCLTASGQKEKLDSLWKVYKKAKHDTSRCNIYVEIGDIYKYNNPDTALLYYEKALWLSDSKKLNKQQALSLRSMGLIYCNLGGYEKAIECYTSSLKISEAISDWYGISSCYNGIGRVYYTQGNYDPAMEYYLKSLKIREEIGNKPGMSACYTNIGIVLQYRGDYKKALEYFNKSLKIDEGLSDKEGMAYNYINIGINYAKQAIWVKAIEYYQRAMDLFKVLNNQYALAAIYNNIGLIYDNQGNYDMAMNYHLKSLKIKEEIEDKSGIASSYINIGTIYDFQDNDEKAKEYFFKSLKMYCELDEKYGISNCYSNIGSLYRQKGNLDSAMWYYQNSIKIKEEIEDLKGISECYSHIGMIYQQKEDFQTALEYFHLSLDIGEKLGNNREIAHDLSAIAAIHLTIAGTYPRNSDKWNTGLKEVIRNGQRSLEIAGEINDLLLEYEVAFTLMKAYREINDYKKAMEYTAILIAASNSIKDRTVSDAEARFNEEKKQLEIDNLNKEKKLQESEMLRQRIVILFSVAGIILIAVFLIFVAQRLRISRRQRKIIESQKALVDEKNVLLNEQNEEIKTQRDEIENQRDEIAAQRDMVTEQRDNIERQNQQITDSITYAKRIQQAIMPSGEIADKIPGEYFILFKPKDIVSGDFYWATRVKEWLIVAVADCTGHGVPGAFMSMLGVSFLNEIVGKKGVTQANEILDLLRRSIIEALQQTGQECEQKDGMDIALCSVNTHTLKLEFSGAYNSLYIVRKAGNEAKESSAGADSEESKGRLEEFKGDKMPIAIYDNMEPFTNYEIQLTRGDCIYLSSDGYEDQFGGPDDKKFKSRNLKELLIRIAGESMPEQGETLDQALEEWMTSHGRIYEQVDDITVLGIKFL
jgi:tetratricopeptide (TPR) repeat protein